MIKKLLDQSSLNKLSAKNKNKIIGLCHGVFDIFHIGHLKHFQYARKHCDILVCSITKDIYINKGPNQPYFNEFQRAEILSSLKVIDYVYISDAPSAENVIKILKPKIYFKGIEYKNKKKDLTKKIYDEEKIVKHYNGKIIYTDEITFSSSKLINNLSTNSKINSKFISQIKSIYSYEYLKKKLDFLAKEKLSIYGEIIIDRYVFCNSLGKSGKEPVLVVSEQKKQNYPGGSLSISNIASNINKNINLFSYIGDRNTNLKFINKNKNKNVKLNFIKKKDSSTIIKTRYLDQNNNIKILGVYDLNDVDLSKVEEMRFSKKIKKQNNSAIICDYGHGLMTNKVIDAIFNSHKKVSVNAQLNASNLSYHSIQKYKKKIFCLVINENELRHETREKSLEIRKLIIKFSNKINVEHILVTRGSVGLLYFSKKNKRFVECPALGGKIVDKVGSGDTVLVYFISLISANLDVETSLLISSLAASKNLEFFANEKIVKLNDVIKSMEHFLK